MKQAEHIFIKETIKNQTARQTYLAGKLMDIKTIKSNEMLTKEK